MEDRRERRIFPSGIGPYLILIRLQATNLTPLPLPFTYPALPYYLYTPYSVLQSTITGGVPRCKL